MLICASTFAPAWAASVTFSEFITLLEQQDERLREEAQILELRREFLRTKVSYWRAVKGGDVQEAERLDAAARALAERLKAWS